ncbi:hypothetical protein TNCV_1488171 [Trichonephila clavipes]|nr:hypothetical protein TNCV_1488171 [Trichonephila clavipes]
MRFEQLWVVYIVATVQRRSIPMLIGSSSCPNHTAYGDVFAITHVLNFVRSARNANLYPSEDLWGESKRRL